MIKREDPNKFSKSFCVYPFTQIAVSPVGVVKPCCIFDGPLKKEDGTTLLISDLKVEEIWNSTHYREIRRKMLQGEPVQECAKCIEEESTGTVSDRILSCYPTQDLKDRVSEAKQRENQISQLPSKLNLKVGNTCNLKCRMCQPMDSSGVDREFTKISEKYPDFRKFDNASAFDYYASDEPIEDMATWITRPQAAENFKELLPKAEFLSLAGGEVTVTPEAMDILKHCVDMGYAKNITLDLASNLTRITPELIELLKAFKLAKVTASIDGTNGTLEYIRYPAQWDTIHKNYLKLLEAPENVIPILSPTVQIYNVLNLPELLGFFDQYRSPKWADAPFCHLTLLFSPEFLSIRNLPDSVRSVALKRLKKYRLISFHANRCEILSQKLDLLEATLHATPAEGAAANLTYFAKYTQILDESRKQSFTEVFPELAQLLAQEEIRPSFPQGPEGKSYSFFRFRNSGFVFQEKDKHQEAIQMFEKALVLEPNDTMAIFSLGCSRKALGMKTDAESCFRQLYAVQPDHYFNLLELAFIEKEQNRIVSAISFLERAEKCEPIDRKGKCKQFIAECRSLG